jgi:hypothetical protein
LPEVGLLKGEQASYGKGFRYQAVAEDAEAIKNFIGAPPGLSTFLDKEAGVTGWHAQF